jgi:hypothetical protein
VSSTPTDLDGPRRVIALKISESESGAKIQKMTKVWGRQWDRDCGILTEYALKIHQQHHKARLNAYHKPQAGEKYFFFLKEATYLHNCLGCDFKFSSTDMSHLSLSELIVSLTIS